MTVKIVELVCVLFCCLHFVTHFLLHRVTHDDTKQYLVFLMVLFYAVTVVFDFAVSAAFLAEHNFIYVFRNFFVIASFFSAVVYVQSLFDDKAFSSVTNVVLYALIGAFFLYIVFRFFGKDDGILDNAVIVTAVFAMIIYLVFLFLRWHTLSDWNRILLISMFLTVMCFSLMEVLRIIGVKYKFFLCIGLIIYMNVYEFLSFRSIFSIVSEHDRHHRKSGEARKNPFGLTKTESEIVDLLRQEISSSKEIATIMNKNPDTIDRHIKNIMAKVGCNNRKDIVSVLDSHDEISQMTLSHL